MNIEKAKEKARKFELNEDYDKAIAAYLKIIQELEGTPDLDGELGLFNKVGDLYLKVGNVTAAVELYERAANRYADSGFPNNAIALCNKILRNAPGRTPVYLKMAKLQGQRGFVAEAKQNLLEYAQRMKQAGRVQEAFSALKEFADLSPDNEEIRLLLAEQLKQAARTDEAREQLAKLYQEAQATGDQRRVRSTVEKMKAIDPGFDTSAVAAKATVAPKRGGKSSDLVFLDLDEAPVGAEEVVEPPPPAPDLEPTSFEEETAAAAVEDEPGPSADLPIDRTSAEFLAVKDEAETAEEEVEHIRGLTGAFEPPPADTEIESLDIQPTMLDDSLDRGAEPEARASDDFQIIQYSDQPGVVLDVPGGEEAGVDVPEIDLGVFGGGEQEGEPSAAPAAADEPPPGPPDVATLESRVADDPDNPQLHRQLAEALMEVGGRQRGLEELDLAMSLHESRNEWRQAEDVTDEILRLSPNSIRHHQKRVEFAFRKGDKGRLADAYLGLGDALFRSGSADRARAVYQRVLEHDPQNDRARLALQTLEPAEDEAPAPPPRPAASRAGPRTVAAPAQPAARGGGGDFVDLGALILEQEPDMRDLRMRIEEEEPTGDEQRDFEEMLSAFKKGIEENLADEDWQAHYDLGVAFKEMGLLDEAISEFQKALRAQTGRLRTAEALGLCFFEKGQFSVAATVLRRAIEAEPGTDEEKIGLLYWLARSEEELARAGEALGYYQRVFAVDIKFQDVDKRVKSLAAAGR